MGRPSATEDRRPSDGVVVELLRVGGPLEICDLASALGVTATAVRQRLDRLVKTGHVRRGLPPRERGNRGRPAHRYELTDKGHRLGGDNFRDLTLVLWGELRRSKDPDVRRGLLTRVGTALAALYRGQVAGATPQDRLESVANLLRARQVSCAVHGDPAGGLPVLTTYACPYPELAEQDRGICAAERAMLEELVGADVKLSECRLDGAACCRFTTGSPASAGADPALESPTVASSNAVRFPPRTISESAP